MYVSLVTRMVLYLDGIGVAVAVSAELRGSQCDASLNGFRLAREVAQVELRFREQILATCTWDVVDPIAQSYRGQQQMR